MRSRWRKVVEVNDGNVHFCGVVPAAGYMGDRHRFNANGPRRGATDLLVEAGGFLQSHPQNVVSSLICSGGTTAKSASDVRRSSHPSQAYSDEMRGVLTLERKILIADGATKSTCARNNNSHFRDVVAEPIRKMFDTQDILSITR